MVCRGWGRRSGFGNGFGLDHLGVEKKWGSDRKGLGEEEKLVGVEEEKEKEKEEERGVLWGGRSEDDWERGVWREEDWGEEEVKRACQPWKEGRKKRREEGEVLWLCESEKHRERE